MILDTNIISEDFVQKPFLHMGEKCTLIHPKEMDVNWNKDNLILRSSIWNSNWELISPSFKKFFNWGERGDLIQKPKSLKGCQAIEKLDGSTLIVSFYNGEFIKRTRGAITAFNHKNGDEINQLEKKYPLAYKNDYIMSGKYTFIYEWVSPTNRIVISYKEADLYLIGVINNEDYTMLHQVELDEIAKNLSLKRPKIYSFASINGMIETVREFKNVEGVCLYFNHGQDILKVKGIDYLTKHRLKSQMNSFKNVLDYYFNLGRPNETEFYTSIQTNIDHETAESCLDHIKKICKGMERIEEIKNEIENYVDTLKHLPKKEAVDEIYYKYSNNGLEHFAFLSLNNKTWLDKYYKKLLNKIIDDETKK